MSAQSTETARLAEPRKESPPGRPRNEPAPEAIDLSRVDAIVARCGRGSASVIPVLQAIQEEFRYLPEAALRRVCDTTDITPAAIVGVSTFYAQFRHTPAGAHTIRLCVGTACHVKGSDGIHDALCRHLGLAEGEDTDRRRVFTVQKVACLGCCTLAPVVQIDEVTYGHVTPSTVPRVLADFLERESKPGVRQVRGERVEDAPEGEIRIGQGSCCVAGGSSEVREAIRDALAKTGVRARVRRVGCVGMCHRTPLMEIVRPGAPAALYARVRPDDVPGILARHFRPKGLRRRVTTAAARWMENLLTDEAWAPLARYSIDVRDPPVASFLRRQVHLSTEHSGTIDPMDIDEYRERDGFAALDACLSRGDPAQVIEEIAHSGLRGRGGAGFPTGSKWRAVRGAAGGRKLIVCNGDEGDPGAFMDRMLLESYPYRVLEGMIIAAWAIGIREGYLYIRAEYPLAVKRVREALGLLEQAGYLGDNIRGSGVSLRLQIMEGAGAFVCGEETALLASIEGKRGMPRLRPPFPAESGLWGCPTLINNVETYALVPWIVRHGADAFAKIGSGKSKGTKVFALAGKIARGGLIEVPMGITIREIVEEIGGGTSGGKAFKAVQVGGPSGGCIPAALADTPVDYEALTAAGAMMGSGGFVVLDENDCMVDMARYFLSFTQRESCGKCTHCRVGTKRMLEIMERICAGKGQKGDIEALEELSRVVRNGSLCGLGKTAPNPVLTTLKYFRGEYEAHLAGRCPAGRCKALIHYTITDDCIGCTRCAQKCPVDAIPMAPYRKHEIDQQKCTRCDTCRQVCPVSAVKVQ